MSWSDNLDTDDLIGYYLIAGLDGRLEDQRTIGSELVRRGQLSATTHDVLMRCSAGSTPLARPIIARPGI